MATTTKNPVTKKIPAKKKPAVKKKPVAKKATAKTLKVTENPAMATDGSDRVHVKDGVVVEVVKQSTVVKEKKAPVKKKKKAKKRVAKKTTKKVTVFDEELTIREEKFCLEYVAMERRNATQAYRNAFRNTTYGTAAVEGNRLLKKPHILHRVKELMAERSAQYAQGLQRAIKELLRMAYYDPRKLFDDDGRIKPINELGPDEARILAGIKTMHKVSGDDSDAVTVITDIKLPDKRANIELLLRLYKATSESTPLNDKITKNVLKRVNSGEITLIDGCYELQIAGLPLPDVMKLQLNKNPAEPDQSGEFCPLSDEEFEKRARERLAEVNRQREVFLPERRAEVAEIKERMKEQDSFAPENFAEED